MPTKLYLVWKQRGLKWFVVDVYCLEVASRTTHAINKPAEMSALFSYVFEEKKDDILPLRAEL